MNNENSLPGPVDWNRRQRLGIVTVSRVSLDAVRLRKRNLPSIRMLIYSGSPIKKDGKTLFKRCSELAVPDPVLLQAWAMQLAELVDQDQKGVTLVLHPDDVGLIDTTMCKVAVRGDAAMLRGNLKLSHSGGWIEKGSAVVLDELRTLIDEFSDVTSVAGHE